VETKAIFITLAVLALACTTGGDSSSRRYDPPSQRAQARDDGRMFYPASGVVCDRAAQVCYDEGRANVAATQRYLGDSAARNLKEGSKDSRKEPKWVFEPDGETSCDMRTQICYGPKGPNVNKTRKYFGDAAGARLQQSLGGTVTKEKKGVGCDESVQICYDENGPNVKKTEKYFGAAAAAKLKKQLKR
jgi:uncharacterized protein (DUF779 family)